MITFLEARIIFFTRPPLSLAILLGLSLAGSSPAAPAAAKTNGLPPEIEQFINDKETQARDLAKEKDLKVSSDVWSYFRTARSGALPATTNAFERLKKRATGAGGARIDMSVGTLIWQLAIEVELAVEALADADGKYATDFGRGVIKSIPAGSIYFGGTDPGRGLVTAYSASHAKGDPFFTITQNALADGRYLEYLRAMYGGKIRTPSNEDSQKAFQEFLADAQKRLEHDRRFPDEPRQIKPGEDVRIIDNRVQVSGQVAVMAINALLCQIIFNANPDREFFIEESFPLDWMYPHLSPHGLILKLNRQPLASLSDEELKKDRAFWISQHTAILGDWLKPETSVKDVCDFARATFGRQDFSEFKADRVFVTNHYASKLYSKLRSSIAGLYNWRALNTTNPVEKLRMLTEADFAFRQAFALCPYSPEAIFRYVNQLVAAERLDDAYRIATTARTMDPDNNQIENLVTELDRLKQEKKK